MKVGNLKVHKKAGDKHMLTDNRQSPMPPYYDIVIFKPLNEKARQIAKFVRQSNNLRYMVLCNQSMLEHCDGSIAAWN